MKMKQDLFKGAATYRTVYSGSEPDLIKMMA